MDTLGRWGGRIHRHKHAGTRSIHQRSGGAIKKKRWLTVTVKLPIRFKATLKSKLEHKHKRVVYPAVVIT